MQVAIGSFFFLVERAKQRLVLFFQKGTAKNKKVFMAEKIINESSEKDIQVPIARLAYSVNEAASLLSISEISIYRLLKRGLLKSSSALRTKIISSEEISRFLRETSR